MCHFSGRLKKLPDLPTHVLSQFSMVWNGDNIGDLRDIENHMLQMIKPCESVFSNNSIEGDYPVVSLYHYVDA